MQQQFIGNGVLSFTKNANAPNLLKPTLFFQASILHELVELVNKTVLSSLFTKEINLESNLVSTHKKL